MAYYQKVQRSPATSDEYYVHVTNLERMTSMCEGPHFPNMFQKKKPLQISNKRGAGQGKTSTTAGRFGRAEHVEYEISGTSCEEDVEVDAGAYVNHSHHGHRVVKSE